MPRDTLSGLLLNDKSCVPQQGLGSDAKYRPQG